MCLQSEWSIVGLSSPWGGLHKAQRVQLVFEGLKKLSASNQSGLMWDSPILWGVLHAVACEAQRAQLVLKEKTLFVPPIRMVCFGLSSNENGSSCSYVPASGGTFVFIVLEFQDYY